jgi:hypothetical protein
MAQKFHSFKEFYPYYLSEHQNITCRRLHFIGSFFVLLIIAYALISQTYTMLFFALICGYLFAWVGHFFFEKNRPATFTYPFYSFAGDWVMFTDILTGKIKL